MPGDAVSVLVLVEDCATMAAKWPDVRDSYLPKLLENLRSADPSVQVRFALDILLTSHPHLSNLDGSAVAHNVLSTCSLFLGGHHGCRTSPDTIRPAIWARWPRQVLASSHNERY